MEQAEELYGEDWDTEEFQTALKVVIKCEIQSLLERLSATGEETVLLTASASELCTGHLASPKALNFVNTSDVGNMKNKFLNFITGSSVPGSHNNKTAATVGPGTSTVTPPAIPSFLFNSYDPTTKKTDTVTKPVDNKSVNVNNQSKSAEKRPLELGQLSQAQINDVKRRKTETTVPALVSKGAVDNSATSVTTAPAFSQSPSNTTSQPAKLKTTKVVSKSGGFTEERLSDAEFQKILAQYKGSQSFPGSQLQMSQLQQKQLQASAGTSKVNKPVSQTAVGVVTSSQNVANQSSVTMRKVSSCKTLETVIKNEIKTETVSDKKNELDKENQPSQALKQSMEKGTDKGPSEKDRSTPSGAPIKKKEGKDSTTAVSENRLENIDSLDTETLIRMTKQKHFENMSEADRAIQAKLGQLSSKLSWVVEYPKDGKGQKSQPGQGATGSKGLTQEGVQMPPPRPFHGSYPENEDEELDEDYDEDEEDEDEFNEDDLDEEDKATLRAMREAHLQKMGNNANIEGFQGQAMFAQGYGLPEGYDHMSEGEILGEVYEESYDDEEDYNEEYGEYADGETESSMHGMMVAGNDRLQGPNMLPSQGEMPGAGALPQPYVGPSSPTAENFQFIGPIMAKCLICNKIIRKTEMKSHNENHMNELPYDEDDDEEDLEELEGVMDEQEDDKYGEQLQPMEEGEEYAGEEEEEYAENYEELNEDQEIEPEFTAEKFVAEKLVAEKLDVPTDSDDSKSLVCELCNKSFKTNSNLQRHRKKIHSLEKEVTEFQCPCCSKSFKTQTNFHKHLKKVHPNYDETAKGDTGEGNESSFKCGVCGTELSSEQLLTEHMETHT